MPYDTNICYMKNPKITLKLKKEKKTNSSKQKQKQQYTWSDERFQTPLYRLCKRSFGKIRNWPLLSNDDRRRISL